LLATLQKKQCCIKIPNLNLIFNRLTEKIKVKSTQCDSSGEKLQTTILHIRPNCASNTHEAKEKKLLIPCIAQKIILSQPLTIGTVLEIRYSEDKTHIFITDNSHTFNKDIACKNTLFNIDTDSIELISS
jgi:hypothetical protein